MWSDNEADTDLLGFQHLTTAVLSIIEDESLLPATIGVFGDWGSGKSSLMRMVREALDARADDGVLVLSFNGWLFEGYEDAKTALMGTIVDEIVARRTLGTKVKENAKRLGYKLLKKIQVFRLLGVGTRTAMAYALGGPPAAGVVATAEGASYLTEQLASATKAVEGVEAMDVGQIEDALKSESGNNLRRSVREFRDEFAEFLRQTDVKTLVVLIDDLDRCMPDTIIETLEAIKLFLFVPHTAFVIGADERLVRYAVRKRFPELPGEKADVGQDYLEKLVQYPVRVPPLGRAEMETYINLLFTKKAGVDAAAFEEARCCVVECDPGDLLEVRYNHGIAKKILGGKLPDGLADNLSLAQRIAPVLAVELTGNPRQCKRFLNMLVMRLAMAKSRGIELQPSVLAKLMLLERFYTESYKQLAKAQAEQAGKPKELAAVEASSQPEPHQAGDDEDDADVDARPAKGAKRQPRGAAERVDIPDWLTDPALKDWVASDPALAGIDLRPYFYFSRDTLGPLGVAMQRMSPAAQEVFASLFREGKAQLGLTLKRAEELGPGDASAVFQALADRVRQEEDPGREEAALARMLDWMATRRAQFGQGMALLNDLPERNLPVALPPRLAQLTTSPEEKATAKRLLEKWARTGSNDRLKAASATTLKKL
jgi:hypothetical protein